MRSGQGQAGGSAQEGLGQGLMAYTVVFAPQAEDQLAELHATMQPLCPTRTT